LPNISEKKLSTIKDSGTFTSGARFEARSVHLSLVPVIPGGRTPPKAAAAAD